MAEQGVIYEFQQRGNYMRVAAVDVASGAEGWIVGPANAAESDLKALALRKLHYVMKRDQGRARD